MSRISLRTIVQAWLLTAVVDGLFSSALSAFAYKSSVSQLWQYVASTAMGPSAFTGGTRTVLIGLLMHAGVALAWTLVFVGLVRALPGLRRAIATPAGIAAVAAVYGPAIWITMSRVVIPLLTSTPAKLTPRWWVQLAGHAVFVALPIVATIGRGGRAGVTEQVGGGEWGVTAGADRAVARNDQSPQSVVHSPEATDHGHRPAGGASL